MTLTTDGIPSCLQIVLKLFMLVDISAQILSATSWVYMVGLPAGMVLS